MAELGTMLLFFFCVNSLLSGLASDRCDTLYLLNLVPYPDNRTFAGWDKGYELIPASRLATKHINNDSDVLQDYKLEVIDVSSEACNINVITGGLTEYFRQLFNRTCVFGVIGLYCSSVTHAIAPIVNHPMMGYVQIAASTSPLHRVKSFPYTFHSITSSGVFNSAMVALMKELKWEMVYVVHGSVGVYFRTTAIDFMKLVSGVDEVSITATIQIREGFSISGMFDLIKDKGGRIGYFTVTNSETAEILCEAYQRDFLWPKYALVFHERSLSDVFSTHVECTMQEMTKALENVFMFQYKLTSPERTRLVSGITYEQYHEEYIEELAKFAMEKEMELEESVYANTLYDQVWAFALAANKSLDTYYFNSSISASNVDDILKIREVLGEKLKGVKFNGSSGFINFGEDQEVQTDVDIFQVRDGKSIPIGLYDATKKHVEFRRDFNRSSVPKDRFDTRSQLIPMWLGSLVLSLNCMLIVLTLFNTVTIIWLRNEPEIKSSSFYLSLVILIGCYSLLFSPILLTVQMTFLIADTRFPVALCTLEFWLFLNGINIILATLLVRLFRIFHIFRSYHSTGKFWLDKYLIFYVALICSPMLILHVIQSVVDPFHLETKKKFASSTNPYKLVKRHCSRQFQYVWLTLSFILIVLVMISVITFAVRTRHIKRKHYKDTKKVNMFLFSVCITYSIFIPLWLILHSIDLYAGSYICKCIANLTGAGLCQMFLSYQKHFQQFLSGETKDL